MNNFKKPTVLIDIIIAIAIFCVINFLMAPFNKNNKVSNSINSNTNSSPTVIKESLHDGMDKKLKQLGFVDEGFEQYCNEKEICLSNGKYFVSYGPSIWLTLKRELDENEVYDSTEDLKLISQMYDNKIILERANIFNAIINPNSKNTKSFFLDMDSLHFYILYTGKTILYDIGNYVVEDDPNKVIDKLDMDSHSDNDYISFLKNIFNDYKKEIPFYDFADYYTNELKNTINVYIYSNFYELSKSKYSFGFETKNYDVGNRIEVLNIPETIFERENVDIIQKDLNYFNNKLDANYHLTNKEIDIIKSALARDGEYTSFDLGNLHVMIYTQYKNEFWITYSFSK